MRKNYLKLHKQAIFQNDKGEWFTHLYNEQGKRILNKRKTREELEDLIIEHYKNLEEIIYIKDVFQEWMDERIKFHEVKKQSIDRYNSSYLNFFKSSDPICKKKFGNISENDLTEFIKTQITEKKLTQKSYSGLVTIINGIFKFGKSKSYTTLSISNFFKDLYIPKNMFQKKFRQRENEIFDEDEIPVLMNYLKENCDIWNLGLILQFQTGMRIGEIAALKPEDVSKNVIHVRRTEIKRKDENNVSKVVVEDIPKTEAGFRDVVITDTARWTLEKINEQRYPGEFLFTSKNSVRIRENTFNKRLTDVLDKLGLRHRSTHKIRKTYGTTLLDNDVTDSIVADQMGHSDVTITRKLYYYCNKSEKVKIQQVNNAIKY